MRKVIWGIAIVFCVQVAFQLAMTASRSDADYARLRTPLQAGIPVPEESLDADDLDTNIAPVEAATEEFSTPTQTRVLIRYIRMPERTHLEPHTVTAAPFKPVVITYDRSGALTTASTQTPERRPTPRMETPADDKRSLIAKVVTKPVDWLKAVGSKFH